MLSHHLSASFWDRKNSLSHVMKLMILISCIKRKTLQQQEREEVLGDLVSF